MALKIWNGSSYTNSKNLKAWNGSTWVGKAAYIWNGSIWKRILPVILATGGSTFVSGSGQDMGSPQASVTAVTSSASVGTIDGGVAPLQYLWEYVSGDFASPLNGTSPSTQFGRTTDVLPGDTVNLTGIYRCKITDAEGNIAYGPNCTVTTFHSNTF